MSVVTTLLRSAATRAPGKVALAVQQSNVDLPFNLNEKVGEYMEQMEEDDEELYKTHFARYLEADVTNDNMEDTWQAVYDKIREDPEHKKSARKAPAKKLRRKAKLSASQRQNRVNQKIASFAAKQDA